MRLDKFRSAICYKICGRIGIFVLPLAFIIAKWCKIVGGTAYGPALVGLFTLVPFLIIFSAVFIGLSLAAFAQSTEIQSDKINTNLVADIGYVMYIILVLSGIFIFGSLRA